MGKTVKEERKEDRRKAVRQREERKQNKYPIQLEDDE